MFVLIKVKRNEIILKGVSGDRSGRSSQLPGLRGRRRLRYQVGEPTHHPATPRLNTAGNKEATGDQRSREEEDKKGEKVGFQEAAAPSPHVQGFVPGESMGPRGGPPDVTLPALSTSS